DVNAGDNYHDDDPALTDSRLRRR
ncbi:MAG: hypothetical protein JWL72_924, partial [Ilumatobacteraceae bacterium]|nr:hypothetical protein [Ilumatobacteraceae bacterium]